MKSIVYHKKDKKLKIYSYNLFYNNEYFDTDETLFIRKMTNPNSDKENFNPLFQFNYKDGIFLHYTDNKFYFKFATVIFNALKEIIL